VVHRFDQGVEHHPLAHIHHIVEAFGSSIPNEIKGQSGPVDRSICDFTQNLGPSDQVFVFKGLEVEDHIDTDRQEVSPCQLFENGDKDQKESKTQ
jgi:hypothetical protein